MKLIKKLRYPLILGLLLIATLVMYQNCLLQQDVRGKKTVSLVGGGTGGNSGQGSEYDGGEGGGDTDSWTLLFAQGSSGINVYQQPQGLSYCEYKLEMSGELVNHVFNSTSFNSGTSLIGFGDGSSMLPLVVGEMSGIQDFHLDISNYAAYQGEGAGPVGPRYVLHSGNEGELGAESDFYYADLVQNDSTLIVRLSEQCILPHTDGGGDRDGESDQNVLQN